MEAINSMAATAAKVVWGENNQTTEEPVSGKLGDTSKGEPYDAGNIEPKSASTGTAETTNRDTTADTVKDAHFSKETGTAAESKDTPDHPSVNVKENDKPSDSSRDQGDVRSPENPKTNPKSVPTDVNDNEANDAEDGVTKAPDVDAPGPRSLTDVAKEHGGDAGNLADDNVKKDESAEKKESDESKESEGTGEKYVKTSGLQADGGDFDATKPGAGREADRLMAQKGMHPNEKPSGDSQEPEKEDRSGSPSSEKKKGLGQKIKEKLHRN